jgi:hypothetical protein
MSVWYLEPEDEITDAVSRLRAAQDDRVVLVVPPGSRIGTGRINFRLLAREAESRQRTITLVSGDPQVRAMASAAGLTAYATVSQAERAAATAVTTPAAGRSGEANEETGETATAVVAGATTTVADAAPMTATATTMPEAPPSVTARLRGKVRGQPSSTQTYAMTPRAASAALVGAGAVGDAGTLGQELSRPRPATQWRRRAAGWGVRATALGALAVGGLYVAYLAVPTAAITLRPRTQEYKLDIPIAANPDYLAASASAGVIPARRIQLPLEDAQGFQTTGQQQAPIAATGVVRFRNKNTFAPGGVVIPKDTVVQTASGTRFKTTESAIVKRYFVNRQVPTVDVPVVALRKGRDGNVPANSITGIRSDNLARALVVDQGGGVNNPEPTSGGRIDQLPYLTDADYKAARTALQDQLERELATELADQDLAGMTLYPDSADLGVVDFEPDLTDLSEADRRVQDFTLMANTNASALAVEDQVVKNTAEEAFRIGLPPGTTVVDDTINVDPASLHGVWNPGTGSIEFPTKVSGQSWAPIDLTQLREQVKGRTVSEAQSILAAYGSADVAVWPDFLPFLPDDARRIELTIPAPEVDSPG